MIALSCGIHEAARLIPCPVCPRVLDELRAEDVGVYQSFSPIGHGKARRKSAQTKDECIRLAKLGKTSREIASALGISTATVQTYAVGLLHGQGARRIDHDEVIRRAKAGQYAREIARDMGISDTTAQKIARGHFVARPKPPKRMSLADRVRAELRRNRSVSWIAKELGMKTATVRRMRTIVMRGEA